MIKVKVEPEATDLKKRQLKFKSEKDVEVKKERQWPGRGQGLPESGHRVGGGPGSELRPQTRETADCLKRGIIWYKRQNEGYSKANLKLKKALEVLRKELLLKRQKNKSLENDRKRLEARKAYLQENVEELIEKNGLKQDLSKADIRVTFTRLLGERGKAKDIVDFFRDMILIHQKMECTVLRTQCAQRSVAIETVEQEEEEEDDEDWDLNCESKFMAKERNLLKQEQLIGTRDVIGLLMTIKVPLQEDDSDCLIVLSD